MIKIDRDERRIGLSIKAAHYDENELVEGKSMKDHLRFSVAYWHTMRGSGADPFGPGTALMPWDDGSDSVANAKKRAEVFFEFLEFGQNKANVRRAVELLVQE